MGTSDMVDILVNNECFTMGTQEATEATRRFGKTIVRPQYYGAVPDYERILQLTKEGVVNRDQLLNAARRWKELDPAPSQNKTLFILGHVLVAELDLFPPQQPVVCPYKRST